MKRRRRHHDTKQYSERNFKQYQKISRQHNTERKEYSVLTGHLFVLLTENEVNEWP